MPCFIILRGCFQLSGYRIKGQLRDILLKCQNVTGVLITYKFSYLFVCSVDSSSDQHKTSLVMNSL